MIKFLRKKFPEIFGLAPSKLQGENLKVKPVSVDWASGGPFKGDGDVVGVFPDEFVIPHLARHMAKKAGAAALKIKTVAVISGPGVDPYLRISFEHGTPFTMPLDGPALFNLNNEVAAALAHHLHRPYGGGG